MSSIAARHEQMFPKLEPREVERLRREKLDEQVEQFFARFAVAAGWHPGR